MKKETWEGIGCFIIIIAFIFGVAFLFNYNNEIKEEKKAKAEALLRQEEEKKEQERKAAEAESRRIGKYLFTDAYGTVHLNQECWVVVEREIGLESNETPDCGMYRVPISEISADDIRNSKLCNSCIDDEIYERLIETCETPQKSKNNDAVTP